MDGQVDVERIEKGQDGFSSGLAKKKSVTSI